MKRKRYGNHRIVVDGESFDSKAEYERYCQLRMLQAAGCIYCLDRQRKYVLVPHQLDENGKVIEREISYKADFAYVDEDGKEVVEDVKSPITITNPEYIMKRKLMLYIHGIRVREILNTSL